MNDELRKAEKILVREFSKDRKMYLATSVNNIPKVQIASIYYMDQCFYLVAKESSELVQNLTRNINVSLCSTSSFHKFQGTADIIGHPQEEKYASTRNMLSKNAENWYEKHVDESDLDTRLIRINIGTGFSYNKKFGYNIDFSKGEAKQVDLSR